jgi:hypothetical protein
VDADQAEFWRLDIPPNPNPLLDPWHGECSLSEAHFLPNLAQCTNRDGTVQWPEGMRASSGIEGWR